MIKHDIVYLLKNDYNSEELRYSLRSVVQNLPYRKIVFVGGCPKDIKPDIYLKDDQIGVNKWERTMHSLKLALNCEDLTEEFYLFNDDFFIMDRVTEDFCYFNGSLERRIAQLKAKNPRNSSYIRSLEILRNSLVGKGKDSLSFALHVPMLISRTKALELFHKKPNLQMFRSYYGNYFEIPCSYMRDVKVYDLETIPDTPFISTTDETFKNGKVGEFLRKYFDKPTKYEENKAKRLRKEVKERYTEEGEIRYES